MRNIKTINTFLFTFLVALSLLNISFISNEFYKNYTGLDGLVFPNTKVIGGDYLAFFTGGTLFKTEKENLYSHKTQFKFQENTVNNHSHTSGFLPFVYPPLVAAFFSFITINSFIDSYLIWSAISFIMYITGIFICLKTLRPETITDKVIFISALIISIGYPCFFLRTLMGGQTGAIGVLLCSVLFLFLRKGWNFSSGIIVSLFYYKPPMFFILLVWSLFTRSSKFILGFIITGFILLLASILIIPLETTIEYFQASLNYSYGSFHYEEKLSVPHKGAGIYAILTSISGISVFYLRFFLVLSVFMTIYSLSKFLKHTPTENQDLFTFSFCISLVASLFFSIHILDYDLSILAPPLILSMLTLYKHNRHFELMPGMIIILIFQLDLPLPDIHFQTHTLSKYSFIHGCLLLYLIWGYHRVKKEIYNF